jgi:LAO/AO transport system kinase
LASHRDVAQKALQQLLPRTGKAIRVGISGVPGVGKSTFIEALGIRLIDQGHRVAVLAIDPSSQRTGGSILGDKTRMQNLSLNENAYIRPSPTSGHLGGVSRVTRESLLLCEAAGFDVILVETVGVGQSETVVSEMVDCYLVLMLPGAGDELQGIKKGVLELADIIAVNKADGNTKTDAQHAKAAYQRALSILQHRSSWNPLALTCSATDGDGLDDLWHQVRNHRRQMIDTGELVERREQQRVTWMWSMVEHQILASVKNNSELEPLLANLETQVRNQSLTAPQAANELLVAWAQSNYPAALALAPKVP